ncbi:MAG: alpha-N-acetylglucosaminidase [Exilibacterium sp.]
MVYILNSKIFSTLWLTVVICTLIHGCTTVHETTRTQEALAARAVLQRVSGASLNNLKLKLIAGNSDQDWYQVFVQDGVATVYGSSVSALSYGAYHYLRDTGALSVSWEGKRVAIPERFSTANEHTSKTYSPFGQRVYLNVCAYGYSLPWWDWQRWEQEIDWMALHGINAVVAMEGQEYVWQKLWREFAITDTELGNYFSGPAFTPWQRMGNIEAHMGPLPQSWIDKKHALQMKILQRLRELGIEPVVPAFGGYVPKQFAEKYPDAKIYKMQPWTGFKEETYWLDPADPLFAKVARRFIEIYNETYGENSYYLSDSFNEMLPPVSEDNRYRDLAAYGEAIYQSIHQVVPEAVWVMQGWMFGSDKKFWDLPSIQAFLSKVPNERTLVHDIGNDRYHVWKGANAFYQKPWVFGYIHNYGGSNPVYGNFNYYRQQITELLASGDSGNLAGFGVFPEGIHNNSVVYEYLYDLPWEGGAKSPTEWLEGYTRARYGHNSEALTSAWKLLQESVFSTQYWTPRWWHDAAGAYLLFKRPETAIVEFESHPGDIEKLGRAVEALLAMADQFKNSPLYLYDLVDFYRHYMTLRIDYLLKDTVSAYQNGNITRGDLLSAKVSELTQGLDLLLGLQRDSLASWIDAAKNYGTTPRESQYYIENAKAQITVWGGPKLKDYASKAWQGMYKDFYLPRWKQFFAALKASAESGTAFDEEKVRADIGTWERQWVKADTVYRRQTPQAPLALMKSLLTRLGEPVDLTL